MRQNIEVVVSDTEPLGNLAMRQLIEIAECKYRFHAIRHPAETPVQERAELFPFQLARGGHPRRQLCSGPGVAIQIPCPIEPVTLLFGQRLSAGRHSKMIEHFMPKNAEQPGLLCGLSDKSIAGLPGGQPDLLYQVLHLMPIPYMPESVAKRERSILFTPSLPDQSCHVLLVLMAHVPSDAPFNVFRNLYSQSYALWETVRLDPSFSLRQVVTRSLVRDSNNASTESRPGPCRTK